MLLLARRINLQLSPRPARPCGIWYSSICPSSSPSPMPPPSHFSFLASEPLQGCSLFLRYPSPSSHSGRIFIFQATRDLHFIYSLDFFPPTHSKGASLWEIPHSHYPEFLILLPLPQSMIIYFCLTRYFHERHMCTYFNESNGLLWKTAFLTLLPLPGHLPLPGGKGFHLFSANDLSFVSLRKTCLCYYTSSFFLYQVLSVNFPWWQKRISTF